jgi:hypothetical protein
LHHAKSLLFFTGSSYAATAVAYADQMGISLFVYSLDGSVKPVNAASWRVADSASAQGAAGHLAVDAVQ